MELFRTYEYRLEYSKEVFTSSQKVVLSEGTPRAAVRAEGILLGLKVRLAVLMEVYESGLMEEEVFLENLKSGFYTMMKKAQKEMKETVGEDRKSTYDGYTEYLNDLRYIKSEVDSYINELENDEEDDE